LIKEANGQKIRKTKTVFRVSTQEWMVLDVESAILYSIVGVRPEERKEQSRSKQSRREEQDWD